MDKIKTIKIKNPDGSVSEETYTISVDAKDVDMKNGKDLQDTIGDINVDRDGSIAEQLGKYKDYDSDIETLYADVDNLETADTELENDIIDLQVNKINKTDIIDNLDSTSATKVLSANQGKVIDDKLKQKAYFFNTVADMKAANLKNGEFACTLGYYAINDGGAADYKIVSSTDNYKETLNNGLFAELIVKNKINVKQVGTYGDGTHDDTSVLKNMFDICRIKNITNVYFPKGTYKITQTLLDYGINGLHITGENDDIYNSTIIKRYADITVFNFGGVMELSGITYRADDLILENLTFRDNEETYVNNVFATFHYTQHFTIQNCSISCRNKSLDLKQCYDSRFINTDFSAGGNSNDAMVTLHGGKHASISEIGWDSANCITFECCRFERYFGTAIRTTKETQPAEYNPTYDPAVAVNVNTIWFNMCRFEAPTLLTGKHLDFNSTSGLRLDIQMTVLDGQTGLKPINFDNCTNIFGNISVGYNQSTVGGATFSDFEEPIINVLNNSGKINLNLIVGTVFNHYLLDYFVNIVAGDTTRRTININLIYNGLNKKLYNQGSSNQNLNIYKHGREIRYGQYENGFGWKVNNNDNNTYFNNMTYDSTNQRYHLQNKYTNSSSTNRTNDEYISNNNFTYHKNNCGVLFDGGFVITPGKYPSTEMSAYRSSSSTGRSIMYASSYPTEAVVGTTFRAGDIIFNVAPTAGNKIGWVCITTGNPGTWKAFGNIDS